MVSVGEKKDIKYNRAMFQFFTLSGDTAPTDTFDGVKIANGSSLKEIDTGKDYLYDEENDQWEEQP